MPRPLLIFSQSDFLIWIVAINSHTRLQTVQIQISWQLQKPTDLDLHCLQRQGIARFSRTRVKIWSSLYLKCTGWITSSADPEQTIFFALRNIFAWIFMANKICHIGNNKSSLLNENLLVQCMSVNWINTKLMGALVGCGEGVKYLMSLGRPTDIGLQFGKACYPCSRKG